MGLTNMLGRYAVGRTHVLAAEVPGEWLVRIHLEAEVVRRGWRLAYSPADADILAVCGTPDETFGGVIHHLWEQMPGPRVRVDIQRAHRDDLSQMLDSAADHLMDTDQHRHDARTRSPEPDIEGASGDMDHGDMEMAPGGIPLAEGARDRDGLEMDVLHLRLGPWLPHWPAGLVVDLTLQGDVIQEADAAAWAAAGVNAKTRPPATESLDVEAIWRCDNIAHLLALAGWEDAAAAARSCRNALVHSPDAADHVRDLEKLRRRVTRSRSLRWSLRGAGRVSETDFAQLGAPKWLVGDNYTRLIGMLDRCIASCAADHSGDLTATEIDPGAVASFLVGLDLAAARLAMASLDLPPINVAAGWPVHG